MKPSSRRYGGDPRHPLGSHSGPADDLGRFGVVVKPGHCPRCGISYNLAGPATSDPTAPSRDHILPKVRGGRDTIHGGVPNVVIICRTCNAWRGSCGHCWGAAACVDAVAASDGATRREVFRRWELHRLPVEAAIPPAPGAEDVPRAPAAVMARNHEAVKLGMVVNKIGPDEFIWPADTAAKRIWNLATLTMAGYRGPVPRDLA